MSLTNIYHAKELLDGTFKAVFYIGANYGQKVDLDINPMSAEALELAGEGKAPEDATVMAVAQDAVHGVAGQDVLKDNGTIVAVKVGDK